MPHPAHTELKNLIRTWYTQSDADMGIEVTPHPHGYLSQFRNAPQQCTVHIAEPLNAAAVRTLLHDAAAAFAGYAPIVLVHGQVADAAVRRALLEMGCRLNTASLYLAHVGDPPSLRPVPGLRMEPMTTQNVRDYVITKLQAFANSEEPPLSDRIEAGIALRLAEMQGSGRFVIGKYADSRSQEGDVAEENAAIISWYEGADRLLLHLATRVPFRRRGIARHLLTQVIHESYARNCRSLMLFTDPEDTPVQLYRRLGFTDEVYWMMRYEGVVRSA